MPMNPTMRARVEAFGIALKAAEEKISFGKDLPDLKLLRLIETDPIVAAAYHEFLAKDEFTHTEFLLTCVKVLMSSKIALEGRLLEMINKHSDPITYKVDHPHSLLYTAPSIKICEWKGCTNRGNNVVRVEGNPTEHYLCDKHLEELDKPYKPKQT